MIIEDTVIFSWMGSDIEAWSKCFPMRLGMRMGW